jgi:manganese/zinc/iron transport system permease protein
MSFWDYFTDPVLRAPTLGSMLMCLASSLIGAVIFLRKRSLLGETLSHAAYPGVVMSVVVVAACFPRSDDALSYGVLVGAFLTALLGLWVVDRMEKKLSVKSDAALCFVLSVFFAVGVLIASRIQTTHSLWYQQIQVFLYGQTATMTDIHIVIYGALAVAILLSLVLLYRLIAITYFDREFGATLGIPVRFVDTALFFLLILAVVIGIRSVGVVLMSGMLIAPAVAARQLTHRLSRFFILSALFGVTSGFLGSYFSLEIPSWIPHEGRFSLPTGPMILLCAGAFCFLSLFFAPKRGVISRGLRILRFQTECRMENLLKQLWKKGVDGSLSIREIAKQQKISHLRARLLTFRLKWQGWVEQKGRGIVLSATGHARASRIVRLHRLWEVYLVTYLGQGIEKVHRSAEEMEHILTPELEKELTELLNNPKQDPHHQPIPERGG